MPEGSTDLWQSGTSNITRLATEYGESVGWVRREPPLCNQPFALWCYLPERGIKKLKNQLYPSVNVLGRVVIISGLTWRLDATWDIVRGAWHFYLRGEMGQEDAEHIEELQTAEGSEWANTYLAWENDLARRRRDGWIRPGLVGVSYRKADANKRMGPKGEVPVGRLGKKDGQGKESGSGTEKARTVDLPASGRCPRGYRRCQDHCCAKEEEA